MDTCKITGLKQGVKNANRVNIFIDGKFSFSLDLTQVVDYKLKIGKELSSEELAELKRASEFGKLYQRTLEWVLMRPRSEKETRDYLSQKLRESSSDEKRKLAQMVIDKIVSRGYVDDLAFAKYYVENRFVKKGISHKRLVMELMKKGVKKDIVEEVLGARNDEEEILKMIAKKRHKYDDDKLIQYLCRQGFDYQLVRNLVSDYGKD